MTSSYDDSRICQGYPRVDIADDPLHVINTEFMQPWYTYKAHPVI
jgi:hypothetical protein